MRIDISSDGSTRLVCTRSEWKTYGDEMGWTGRSVKEASEISIRLSEDASGHKRIIMNRAGWEHIGRTAGFDDEDGIATEDDSAEDTATEEPERFEIDDHIDQEMDIHPDQAQYEGADQPRGSIERAIFDAENTIVETIISGASDGQMPITLVPQGIMDALKPVLKMKNIDTETGDPVQILERYVSDTESYNEKEEGVKDIVRNQLDLYRSEV